MEQLKLDLWPWRLPRENPRADRRITGSIMQILDHNLRIVRGDYILGATPRQFLHHVQFVQDQVDTVDRYGTEQERASLHMLLHRDQQEWREALAARHKSGRQSPIQHLWNG